MPFETGLEYVLATICLFVAIVVASQPGSRRDHLAAFAAFLFLEFLEPFELILAEMGVFDRAPELLGWLSGAATFSPFALFAYTRAMTSPCPLTIKDFSSGHALLCGAVLLLTLPLLLFDGEAKLALLMGEDPLTLDQETMTYLTVSVALADLASEVIKILYIALALRLLQRHHDHIYDIFSNIEDKTLNWLRLMLFILGATVVYNLVDGTAMILLGTHGQPYVVMNLIHTISMCAICFLGVRQGAIYERLGSAPTIAADFDLPIEEEIVSRQVLPEDQVARITRKLTSAMRERRLYRDPSLTLRQLSDATGISEHRISEVLNRHMQTNFYDFINRERIGEAKQILKEHQDRTVLDIAMAVGFNSKSTFYTAFKKVTDQNPLAYRKKALASLADRPDARQAGGAAPLDHATLAESRIPAPVAEPSPQGPSGI